MSYSAKTRTSSPSDLVYGINLPTLAEAFFDLKRAIDSHTTDRGLISKILMRDPVMCARTLKLANSAYFMSGREIQTIDDAVQILGTNVLTSIAMAVYVVDSFRGIDSDLVDMKKFWKQSIRMGLSARSIAKFTLTEQQHAYDHYFIAAMLSRIGKLVMYVECPQIAEDIIKQANEAHVPKYIIEKQLLDYTHADVSYELLKHWELSPSIYEPIPHYIFPDEVPDEYKETAYLIHAAYYMQFGWFHNGEGHYIELPSEPSDLAYEYLGIKTMDLMACTTLVDEEFGLLCSHLNLN